LTGTQSSCSMFTNACWIPKSTGLLHRQTLRQLCARRVDAWTIKWREGRILRLSWYRIGGEIEVWRCLVENYGSLWISRQLFDLGSGYERDSDVWLSYTRWLLQAQLYTSSRGSQTCYPSVPSCIHRQLSSARIIVTDLCGKPDREIMTDEHLTKGRSNRDIIDLLSAYLLWWYALTAIELSSFYLLLFSLPSSLSLPSTALG